MCMCAFLSVSMCALTGTQVCKGHKTTFLSSHCDVQGMNRVTLPWQALLPPEPCH